MRRWKGLASATELNEAARRLLQTFAAEVDAKGIHLWQVVRAHGLATAPSHACCDEALACCVRVCDGGNRGLYNSRTY